MAKPPLPPPSSEETSPHLPVKSPPPLGSLLATEADYGLTVEEQKEVTAYQKTMAILGPAGGAILVCPGNQDDIDEQDKCPHSAKCPLLRMHKAVPDKLCMFELQMTQDRFGAWCQELEADPIEIKESERVSVSDLVWLDVQQHRCLNILSKNSGGEETRLLVTNPKEVHPETFQPIAWEKKLHPVVERLTQIISERRLILKDLLLTREAKWKVARAEGKGSGKDLASRQSSRADKLRKLQEKNEA
jgi:hypothetical protein